MKQLFPQNIEFANPWLLLLLLVIPILIFMRVRKKNKAQVIEIPSIQGFQKTSSNILPKFFWILFVLRIVAIALLIVALARPRVAHTTSYSESQKGVDIFMVVDVSYSMLAKDLEPDRITALRDVAEEFARNRKTDRIGLLAYSAEALTKVPLTSDREILINEIRNLNPNELDPGTAIGVGLATATNHFRNSKAVSKVIILLTDGENNAGMVDPLVAAQIAKSKGIKVYTIGLGTNGEALFPVNIIGSQIIFDMQPVHIDENLLKEIAVQTKGKYFRATNKNELSAIYKEIDRLEKSQINELKYYDFEEKFRIYALWAFIFLVIEGIVRFTLFKSVTE